MMTEQELIAAGLLDPVALKAHKELIASERTGLVALKNLGFITQMDVEVVEFDLRDPEDPVRVAVLGSDSYHYRVWINVETAVALGLVKIEKENGNG